MPEHGGTMTTRRTTVRTAALLALTLLATTPLAATTATASPGALRAGPAVVGPVDLGTLGGAQTMPWAVNDKGQVVGQSQVADGTWHAFLWSGGAMTDLAPDAPQSLAFDINNRGEVTGYVQPQPGEPADAVVWKDGTTTQVAHEGYGQAINERGQVSGTVTDLSVPADNPYLWTAGARVDLGPLPFPDAVSSSVFVDLTKDGTILGRGNLQDETEVTFTWSAGTFTELGDATGPMIGLDINDKGHVAGSARRADWSMEAAIWRTGALQRLGVVPGATSTRAVALNEKGLVAGVSDGPGGSRAFVWTGGALKPIAVVSGGTSEASDVNDRGQVAGRLGFTLSDGTHAEQAFVWQGGALTRLGSAQATEVYVADLSEKGHVITQVGTFGQLRAVLWTVPQKQS